MAGNPAGKHVGDITEARARQLSVHQLGIVRRGDRAVVGLAYAGEIQAAAVFNADQLARLSDQAATIALQMMEGGDR